MTTLVDTSVWSLALRRRPGDLSGVERSFVHEWRSLVVATQARIIGIVRQEVLSGFADAARFRQLRERLRDFPDEAVTSADHEHAAELSNTCLRAGVMVGQVDILVCAVATRIGAEILTTDSDFRRIAAHIPIQLHPLSRT